MNERTKTINGIEYTVFSLESANYGGISQKDAIALLAEHGIKARRGAWTPYVGHYGLWVEAKYQNRASDLLFH
jgi:hypothetical protein